MLISDEYRSLNRDLHARATFGQRGARHADIAATLHAEHGGPVLDYGCGRADLSRALAGLGIAVINYDPGRVEYDAPPQPCPVVVCTDVLEHVEPECLEAVLSHLAALTLAVAHFVIATKPDGRKKLADGRDPHLIVQPPEWWHDRLAAHFAPREIARTHRDVTFRCCPRT